MTEVTTICYRQREVWKDRGGAHLPQGNTERKNTMPKWYVEYRAYGKPGYMGKIEAKDGKEAIEYVKAHVIGAQHFKVWHDDDDEE